MPLASPECCLGLVLHSGEIVPATKYRLLKPITKRVRLVSELKNLTRTPVRRRIEDEAAPLTVSGQWVVSLISYMLCCVERQLVLKPGETLENQQRRLQGLKNKALLKLCKQLNRALPERSAPVTQDLLCNPGSRFGLEFGLFLADYCRILANDPNFYFNCGLCAFPRELEVFSDRDILECYQQLSSLGPSSFLRVAEVIEARPGRVFVRWHGRDLSSEVGERHRDAFLFFACQHVQGQLAAVPWALFDECPAACTERSCLRLGHEYCEWELQWRLQGRPRSPWGASTWGLSAVVGASMLGAWTWPRWLLAALWLPLVARFAQLSWQRERLLKELETWQFMSATKRRLSRVQMELSSLFQRDLRATNRLLRSQLQQMEESGMAKILDPRRVSERKDQEQ